MSKVTAFQHEVLKWTTGYMDNENVSDDVRTLAFTKEMDEVVGSIADLLGTAGNQAVRKGAGDITTTGRLGFAVWRDGSCWNLNDTWSNRVGTCRKLSEILYGSGELLEALMYRGSKEGFRVSKGEISHRWSNKLKSLCIIFMPPETPPEE